MRLRRGLQQLQLESFMTAVDTNPIYYLVLMTVFWVVPLSCKTCVQLLYRPLNFQVAETVRLKGRLPISVSLCNYYLTMEPTFMRAQKCPLYLGMHIQHFKSATN